KPTFTGTTLTIANIVFAFQRAYAGGLLIVGRVMDWLGTRKGFSLAVFLWSVAAMAHALAHSLFGFGAARFALGLGESGSFPASIKSVAESSATNLWAGVLLVSLAAAAHQGWSVKIFNAASDMFPRRGQVGRRLGRHGGRSGRNADRKDCRLHPAGDGFVSACLHQSRVSISGCTCSHSYPRSEA